jgi:hypothetical protein
MSAYDLVQVYNSQVNQKEMDELDDPDNTKNVPPSDVPLYDTDTRLI